MVVRPMPLCRMAGSGRRVVRLSRPGMGSSKVGGGLTASDECTGRQGGAVGARLWQRIKSDSDAGLAIAPRSCQHLGMRWAGIFSTLMGAASATWLFPFDFISPMAGGPWRMVGDAAQHAVAQRYFWASPWGWPPLDVTFLGGLNLAFADGIPALALPLKLVAGWLPEGFHGIGLWYVLCWSVLPGCAVWAMRGADETRFWPLLCIGLAAVSMPAFIMRFGHAALCGHFLLWLALGVYLRAVAGQRVWPAAVALQVGALLVHPYLAVMVLAVLAAAPLSLAWRGARFATVAISVAAAMGAMSLVMAAFGYFGASGDGQRWYGEFGLNLLSPLWPFRSWFLGAGIGAEIDATERGGWEGYNWQIGRAHV